MRFHSLIILTLGLSACSGVKSVQLRPPTLAPGGLVSGYGIERIQRDEDKSRDAASAKALTDLLYQAVVTDPGFRGRASQILQPAFKESGTRDGFVWVLLGATPEEIVRARAEFAVWRKSRIDEAAALYDEARGLDRLARLKASLAILEEIGAREDHSVLYQDVQAGVAQIEDVQREFRGLADSGYLSAAEQSLDEALQNGLDPGLYQEFRTEVMDRRKQALAEMLTGDQYFRDEEYKQALRSYSEAGRLDRDNSQIPSKIAMAEDYHRAGRMSALQVTVSAINQGTRLISEYLDHKREEDRRKREEAERREREDARRRRRGPGTRI